MSIFRKAKYSTIKSVKKKDIPHGLWEKCKNCNEVVYKKQREKNLNVCPRCSYHHPITAKQRIELLTDPGSFVEVDSTMKSVDVLKFESYKEKLRSNEKKTGMKEAIICGRAKIDGRNLALGIMDFRFLGGSMASVVGEKVTRLTELATKERLPLVIVTASGGARMYEGMLSLMQMAKTSGALSRHAEAGLPYIVIMTHPTTAGVTASFASLGDLIFAEPKALIGFAGPRVIKDTTQAELPEGFQSSEFLMKRGLIDRIIERKNLRHELSLCLEYFSHSCKVYPDKKNSNNAQKAEMEESKSVPV